MMTLTPISPGEVLNEEFLKPMNITAYRLANITHMPQSRISNIIKGTRRITADTAMRLSKAFGTTPEFWLNLQNRYDIDTIRYKGLDASINSIQTIAL